MNRRHFLTHLSSAGALLLAGGSRAKASGRSNKPNILLIIADDTTWSDLSCYGGKNVATPHIDALAAEGMLFHRSYTGMAMCVPCRHELYTGLYPLGNGACWNHSTSRDGTKSICQYLRPLGYRVGLTGKCHAQPKSVFPFEILPGFEPNCVHKKPESKADVTAIKAFMIRNDTEPFCLAVGLVDAHIPWTTGTPGDIKKQDVVLPPTLPDIPAVRTDYVKYLAEVAALDHNVGRVLNALDATGQRDTTIVIFTSEQGAQWPGAKWTNWEDGLRTGLIVRWPGKIKAGSETDALVQYADILPTLLQAAGGGATAALDGSSFLEVLQGTRDSHRQYAYAMHNNLPEGPPYPIRSVTNGRYRYLRNLTPETEYAQRNMEETMHVNGHPYWPAWKKAAEEESRARELYVRFRNRPPEELYDISADPHCLANLAENREHLLVKTDLSHALDAWMKAEGDPGAALDTPEAFEPRSVKKMHQQRRAAKQKEATSAPPTNTTN